MALRSGLDIKKEIIGILRKNNVSLRKLETKLNTNNKTILMHIRELEFLGVVKITKTKEGSRNGKAYSIVELTEYGRKLKI